MQVTVQPLIRPLQPTSRNQPVQVVAPIVYSFRQPNYANKMSGSYVNNKSVQTTNSETEQKALNIDDDNFADILGYVRLIQQDFLDFTRSSLEMFANLLSTFSNFA